jgi:DNA (cytosine-5)-methyltransferase 1
VDVAYSNSARLEGHRRLEPSPGEQSSSASSRSCRETETTADSDKQRRDRGTGHFAQTDGRPKSANGDQWIVEPDVGRVANGIPARVDRIRALGNALVPQIAEWIGHQIMSYELDNAAVA